MSEVAVLITGRGNNTLENKNILPVLGKPLMTYPAVEASKIVRNNLFVSSDCDEILSVGESVGYKPIRRPDELAAADSKHVDTIFHALDVMKNDYDLYPDILVVLLANSATVKGEWIEKGIEMIQEDSGISSVVPVHKEQDHHPYRAKKLNVEGNLVPYFDFSNKEISTNRQELPDNYFLCHNFWILNVDKSIRSMDGFKPWCFMGATVKPIVVEDCFDVHTMADLIRTEEWLRLYGS